MRLRAGSDLNMGDGVLDLVGFFLRRRWIKLDFYCLHCVAEAVGERRPNRYGHPAYAVVRGLNDDHRHLKQLGVHLPDRPRGAISDVEAWHEPGLVASVAVAATGLGLARSLATPVSRKTTCKRCQQSIADVPAARSLPEYAELYADDVPATNSQPG